MKKNEKKNLIYMWQQKTLFLVKGANNFLSSLTLILITHINIKLVSKFAKYRNKNMNIS